MHKGDLAHNFTILDTVDLPELKARGVWARHKTGAELFHVENGDSENLFAFAFATPPEDSSGAAHILEHSVLCGSRNYPLKDAFLVLAQGSLQTYLNAWTFPDKTIYPASSVNETDYFNLMAVYGDAVFRPVLSEWTFMQEGWRLERSAAGGHGEAGRQGGLEYTGVVYNEMKGAYSSPDSYAGLWSVKAVMPDTPYAFESGGDPDKIPDLSWEGLKEFHRSRYSPGNCRIFLAGNIPTEKQMEFLDRVCLAGFDGSGGPLPIVGRTKPWTESRFIRVPCPGGGSDSKPQAFVSWLCSDTADASETMALACLAEILLGHDGSPLTRALLESGLGEDLSPSSGLETELRETVFCAGLRGIEAGNSDETYRRMEKLIFDELKKCVKEGIPKEEIEAALLSIEFSNREIRRSHGPYSLVWLRRSLRGWLNGGKPWDALRVVQNLEEVKKRLAENGRYFESLIEKYLLENPHRSLTACEPEEDFLEKKEAALMSLLAEKEKAMDEAEQKALDKKNEELAAFQAEGESPDALAAIPHLSRKDLVPELEAIPREFTFIDGDGAADGVPVLLHPVFTNGISYAELAFPVDTLPPEEYPWLPFFARTVVSMGMDGMDYAEVSSLLARTAGNFYAMLESGTPAPDSASGSEGGPGSGSDSGGERLIADKELLGRDWIIFKLKALDEKLESALDLTLRLIRGADFSDLRRLRDLVVEMKNDGDSSLAPSGQAYAAGRSGKACSRSRAVDEIWNGLYQLPFSHELAAMDTAEISRRLSSIRDAIISRAGLIINLTASAEALPGALSALTGAVRGRFGPPAPANKACREVSTFLSMLDGAALPAAAEVWASPSLQIGFAAMSLPAALYGSREQAAELVFSHELSTGALWESVRMKGGAYGVSARPDNLEGIFSFSTYRDPDPLRSLKAFPEILRKRSRENPGEDSLEKAIIGTFSRETSPRTPADNGFTDFLRYVYGITAEHKFRRLKNIISLTTEETSAVARRLAEAASGSFAAAAVIVAGTKTAEKAAKALGVNVRVLPV